MASRRNCHRKKIENIKNARKKKLSYFQIYECIIKC